MIDQGQDKFIDFLPPFTIVGLILLRKVTLFHLFQKLAQRMVLESSKGCFFDDVKLLTMCRFRLFHVDSKKEGKEVGTRKAALEQDKTRVFKMIESCFKYMHPDDIISINKSFDRSQAMYIVGYENDGKKSHVVAAVLYVLSKDGAYINWFAVSPTNFDNERFGKLANNKPFRCMGLASFLLKMVQMQLIAKGWCEDLYLQANMSSHAATYYENRGFVKTPENDYTLSTRILSEML